MTKRKLDVQSSPRPQKQIKNSKYTPKQTPKQTPKHTQKHTQKHKGDKRQHQKSQIEHSSSPTSKKKKYKHFGDEHQNQEEEEEDKPKNRKTFFNFARKPDVSKSSFSFNAEEEEEERYEDEEEEDAEENEENENTKEDDKKAKKKAQKEEAKKRKEIRKSRKPYAAILSEIKRLYEKFSAKNIMRNERQELVQQILTCIKGNIAHLAIKHDASRIIQMCLKHGNNKHRRKIVFALQKHVGALSKSIFGHFLAKKLFRYAQTCGPDLIPHLLKNFYTNVKKMAVHRYPSNVIEYAYANVCTPLQKQHIIEEFYLPEFKLFKTDKLRSLGDIIEEHPTKKQLILDSVYASLEKMINKGIVFHTFGQRVLLEFFRNGPYIQWAEYITTLEDSPLEFLDSEDGLAIATHCLTNGTPKDRKALIKKMKDHVFDYCIHKNGHVMIMRALEVVDDTSLLNRIILAEIRSHLEQVVTDYRSLQVILHLLAPSDKRYFHTQIYQEHLKPAKMLINKNGEAFSPSKKDPQVRRKELLLFLMPDLLQLCSENLRDMLIDRRLGSFFLELMAIISGPNNKFLSNKNKILQQVVSRIPDNWEDKDNILCHISANRYIKQLINLPPSSSAVLLNRDEADPVCEELDFGLLVFQKCKKELHHLAAVQNSCWVVLGLLEHVATYEQAKSLLKEHLPSLENCEFAGTKKIVSILKG